MSDYNHPPVPTFQPEKLNLWDRFFNRYRKTVYRQERFLVAAFVDYLIVDRLTGSVEIKREYL